MLKKLLIGLLLILVVIQFIKPDKNESNDLTYDMAKKYNVPADVNNLLQVSCNDCHTNKTEYPWYANVQPVAWWLDHHVQDGKKHLNFSEFTNRPLYVQNHKFDEIIEMVDEGEMPLASYTYFGLHPKANLTDEQRTMITDWAKAQMEYLKRTYPADSLVFPKRD
ncbi:heme-binding domain-containing protein [Flavobacteriaceae bacterium TP-CH-4]|uniref:Heme-binding domain-containing protein n=1 Tax=Pelagihabitans pacificus TaxID=2696054 RepID=A0A967ECV7_9FLAO|nr:heme-binding domain-containing protein [Pelagihabitans pacificus]NHF61576.1 heme-binding domain-containing protein [Pelagihabitans pacificus]